MSTFSMRAKSGLILVACLGASSAAWSAPCSGPPALEAHLRAHPDADAYAALGNWFGENNKSDCAVQAFQAGLKLEPNSAPLSYLLGLSLYTAGRIQEAVAPLQQSIRLHPGEVKAHLVLGAALASLGRDKEALPEWQAALKIDPASMMALDGLSKALIASGDYKTVITHLRSAKRDENLTLDLAAAYGKAGMYDDAALVLGEGLKAYPDSNSLTDALVTVYVRQTRYQEAAALAEKL
ncbi:MAG: tetratricopeptide repeat protein, partial [Terracidiphilus sp.]